MEVILDGLQESYVELVKLVINEGKPVTVRGMKTYEITNATLVFPDATEPMLPVRVGRKINAKLAAVETLDMIAGTSSSELVRRAAPEYGNVLVDPSDLDYGAYGPRLSNELQQCVTLLRMDPTTRQAVVTIWKPTDITHAGDRPCTIFMQFLIRDEKLELHTTMRSNDVWLGTPYDVFAFTQIQQTVAYALERETGRYVHNATSLHLYDRDVLKVDELTYAAKIAYELPNGVRPRAGIEDVTQRRNFIGLQNTAYLMLNAAHFGPPPDMPFATASLLANPWYAGQLEKLVQRKEVQ